MHPICMRPMKRWRLGFPRRDPHWLATFRHRRQLFTNHQHKQARKEKRVAPCDRCAHRKGNGFWISARAPDTDTDKETREAEFGVADCDKNGRYRLALGPHV